MNLSIVTTSSVSASSSSFTYKAGRPGRGFLPFEILWLTYLKSVTLFPSAFLTAKADKRKSPAPKVEYSRGVTSGEKLCTLAVGLSGQNDAKPGLKRRSSTFTSGIYAP